MIRPLEAGEGWGAGGGDHTQYGFITSVPRLIKVGHFRGLEGGRLLTRAAQSRAGGSGAIERFGCEGAVRVRGSGSGASERVGSE